MRNLLIATAALLVAAAVVRRRFFKPIPPPVPLKWREVPHYPWAGSEMLHVIEGQQSGHVAGTGYPSCPLRACR